MAELRENVVEWLTGDDRITMTLTQKRHINKARRLVEYYTNHGDPRADLLENPDGSVFVHLPLEALKLSAKTTRTMSEEQKRAASDRLRAARSERIRSE